MAIVFFSYSHKDEDLRDQLEVHLTMLKRQGLIDAWHDRRITVGQPLDPAINIHLDSADVILCLVSPDFIASDYCYSRETERALQRHKAGEARVIPVILRYCEWEETPLKGLMGTPPDNKPIMAWPDRDQALNLVARDIRKALEEMGHLPTNSDFSEVKAAPKKVEIVSAPPRSSNLHIKREFSDFERDSFLREAFEFIAEFFAHSIKELKSRHQSQIDGRFDRLDGNRFTVSLYKSGKKQSAMTVFLGGMFGAAISFNNLDAGQSNSISGSFSLQQSDDALRFNADLFDFNRRNQPKGLEPIHVAEALWEQLMMPLQN